MTNAKEKGGDGEVASKVSVKLGEFQIQLEGTQQNVATLMGKPVYEFIKELRKIVGEIP